MKQKSFFYIVLGTMRKVVLFIYAALITCLLYRPARWAWETIGEGRFVFVCVLGIVVGCIVIVLLARSVRKEERHK